jgi:hypothetical protein
MANKRQLCYMYGFYYKAYLIRGSNRQAIIRYLYGLAQAYCISCAPPLLFVQEIRDFLARPEAAKEVVIVSFEATGDAPLTVCKN